MNALYAIGVIITLTLLVSLFVLYHNKQREKAWHKVMHNKNKENG